MKKPTPPRDVISQRIEQLQNVEVVQQAITQATQNAQTSQKANASTLDMNDPFALSQPLPPPSNFFELMDQHFDDVYIDDNIIEGQDIGTHDTHMVPEGFSKLCLNCKNYWNLTTLAPVKNVKPDGSPFHRIEEYCIFSDKLFTLSERSVVSCTRFKKKKDESQKQKS